MERDMVFGKKLYYICLNNKKLLNTIKEKEKQGRRQFFFQVKMGKKMVERENGKHGKVKTENNQKKTHHKERIMNQFI